MLFDNMEYMNRQAQTVYLKASPDVLFQHLKMGKVERPLLKDKTEEEMKQYIRDSLAIRRTLLQPGTIYIRCQLIRELR